MRRFFRILCISLVIFILIVILIIAVIGWIRRIGGWNIRRRCRCYRRIRCIGRIWCSGLVVIAVSVILIRILFTVLLTTVSVGRCFGRFDLRLLVISRLIVFFMGRRYFRIGLTARCVNDVIFRILLFILRHIVILRRIIRNLHCLEQYGRGWSVLRLFILIGIFILLPEFTVIFLFFVPKGNILPRKQDLVILPVSVLICAGIEILLFIACCHRNTCYGQKDKSCYCPYDLPFFRRFHYNLSSLSCTICPICQRTLSKSTGFAK